jgi:WD40 repeat protein
MRRRLFVLILPAAMLLPVGAVRAQGDRRERAEPALMIETGARMGTCDALAFTPDGRYLLAAGDDKVVRVWTHTAEGLEQPACQTLRWSIWRERRGAIYALAISPDSAGTYVAMGGLGVRNGSVVVVERASGRVVHALALVKGNEEVNSQVTWSLAFSPSGRQLAMGKEDGSVWLWTPGEKQGKEVRKLGSHPNPDRLAANRVRLVSFLDETQVLSAARDGTALVWNLKASAGSPRVLFRFDIPSLFRVALSRDQQRIAAAGEARRVEVRSLAGRLLHTLELEEGQFPHSLAFDPKGGQLAVGVRVIDPRAGFFKETQDRIALYDLRADPPRASPGPRVSFHADVLAFHPTEQRLAVAGGNNHEVTLWDLHKLESKPLTVIRGPGAGLWSVRFSQDGNALGFQTERQVHPSSPNQRGAGAWHVFNLQTRTWADAADFQTVEPRTTAGGWTVRPDAKDAYLWHVVSPDGKVFPLADLKPAVDGMPRCYTFLEPRPGQRVRLAVGHYWGFSLFELDRKGPRRIRLFNGHQGDVTSLAASADQQVLLTASRDQTIAAWSLRDWPTQSPLGAAFDERLGKLFVDAVDPGSPAWEAGLARGDEIVRLAIDGVLQLGGPSRWLERLRRPAGNVEHYFEVKRVSGEPAVCLTRVRERPLWHFFPTREREWVLWRHHDYYYDASLNGDAWIGWQISRDVDQKPEFYPARQFSGRFYSPERIEEALRHTRLAPEHVQLVGIEPPELALATDSRVVTDGGVSVDLRVTPRGPREAHRPERVILWIGDYRYREWQLDPRQRDAGPFAERVTIPADLLRCGDNRLSLQATSSQGLVRTVDQIVVRKEGRPRTPRLFLLQVAVADYAKVKVPRNIAFPNLPSVKVDLELVKEAWKKQEKTLFEQVEVVDLVNSQVTPAALEQQFQAIARKARPDDLLVLFLNGHGFTQLVKAGLGTVKEGTFVFLGPRFDWERPAETGITADLLYRGVTSIPCRKLVLLSACHAGDALQRTPREPVRDLMPGGVGPIVLSAAQHSESAFADDFEGSLFARAIVEALDHKLLEASHGKAELDTVDLVAYVQRRVAAMLAEAQRTKAAPPGSTQTPVAFPEPVRMERFLLARRNGASLR